MSPSKEAPPSVPAAPWEPEQAAAINALEARATMRVDTASGYLAAERRVHRPDGTALTAPWAPTPPRPGPVLLYKEDDSMRTGRPKAALVLTEKERQLLNSYAHRSRTTPGDSGHKARIAPPPLRVSPAKR